MPVVNGQKFACESCIRGHRVSNCHHEDRPLKLIPPKGRPVKQCEHCRTARKSKSHHGKCDCGSKKEKKEKPEPKVEVGCCCHNGENCTCGSHNDNDLARMERSLKRPTQPVKSKPQLATSTSEGKLTVFANGHHKPCHRNNNLAHTSGVPYKIPRPHTLHGISAFAKTEDEMDLLDSLPRSADDMWIPQNSRTISPPTISRTNSEESFDFGEDGSGSDAFSFDFDKHFSSRTDDYKPSLGSMDAVDYNALSSYWSEQAANMSSRDFLGLSINATASPNFTDVDWPSIFSPADLPLPSSQINLTQTVSHSGDSTYQSLPGLTSNSSNAQESETEPVSWDASVNLEQYYQAAQLANGQSMKAPQPRHMSSSSAITAINFGSPAGVDADNNAILIPAGSDADDEAVDDWNDWEGALGGHPTANSEMTRNYSWLM